MPKITHYYPFVIAFKFVIIYKLCKVSVYYIIKGQNIKFSIIIPVYNEININNHLKNLKENESLKDYEIIVVDGNEDSSIKLIEDKSIIKTTSLKGRANQMNKGAFLAKGKILLFLHADTILPKEAFFEIENILKKEDIKAGAFDLDFDTKNVLLKTIAKTASLRSRLTKLPYGDQAIFIKKDVFEKVNFFEDMPLMEDINLMQKLKKEKFQIEISTKKVITSARKWENEGVFYTTFRNWVLVTLYLLGVSSKKLVKYYYKK